jgi:ribonuclease BN (tRNA processing enzyme)
MSPRVRLRVLGCGDAFGSGGRFQTCLYLEGAGDPLLIDCGATALVAMKRAGIDPAGIGWVALSHLHGDHFAGLPFLILDGQIARRTRPLVIAGPPGTPERVEDTLEALFPGASAARRSYETRFAELVDGSRCGLGPAAVTPFAVSHPSGAPAHALRIEYGGRVFAYSGDTDWTENLVAVSRGADLFVCEALFFEKRVPHHLDYRTLAARRAELDCERLVLTHMSEDMLARVDELDVEAAADGAEIAI